MQCERTADFVVEAAHGGDDLQGHTKMTLDPTYVDAPKSDEHPAVSDPATTSKGATVGSLSQPKIMKWDDIELGTIWDRDNPRQLDTFLNSFKSPEDCQSSQLSYTDESRPLTPFRSEQETGCFEKYGHTTEELPEASVITHNGGLMVASSNQQSNMLNSVIAELSALNARLSAVQQSSSTLAKAALSSSPAFPTPLRAPLIDAAALKSVGVWLAHDHCFKNLGERTSFSDSTGTAANCQNVPLDTDPQGARGILHDVFSASQCILGVLGTMQAKTSFEPMDTYTASAVMNTFTSSSGDGSKFSPGEDLWPCKPLFAGPTSTTHTLQIVRHLIIACQALLFGIYIDILTALQHDIFYWTSEDGAALKDVQFVMAVQLLSYLLERQYQAMDLYLTPQCPISPVSINEISDPHFSVFTPPQQFHSCGSKTSAVTDIFHDFKTRLDKQLTSLRQTSRCT